MRYALLLTLLLPLSATGQPPVEPPIIQFPSINTPARMESLDMPPTCASDNSVDCGLVNAKRLRQFVAFADGHLIATASQGGVLTTNAQNIRIGQFGNAVASTLCLASLSYHIGGVIRNSSQEQMAWIDAGRVVASMKNAQPARDWANEEFIRNAMGAKCIADLAVSKPGLAQNPRDASGIRLFANAAKKLNFDADGLPPRLASTGAVSPPPLGHLARPCCKLRSANFARQANSRSPARIRAELAFATSNGAWRHAERCSASRADAIVFCGINRHAAPL